MTSQPEFKPFPLFSGCHAQTVAASLLTFYRDLLSYRRFVHLRGGERIALEITTPPNWKPEDPTVVLVHGLCGSYKSPYLVRLTRKLYRKGIRSIRLNLRGCGSSKGYSKKLYAPDASEDVWKALQEIKRDTPDTPITVMGFSLGGNIVLKMAGERKEEAKKLVDNLVAINPPIDMHASVRLLNQNRLYERYFMRCLRSDVYTIHENFEELPPIKIPSGMKLMEFDEFYIAPQAGYSTAEEYYYAASSGPLLPDIRVPCHILFAKDDPIVDCSVFDSFKVPKNIEVLITERGGHIGYLGRLSQKGGFHWMDSVLLQWILDSGNTIFRESGSSTDGPDSLLAS